MLYGPDGRPLNPDPIGENKASPNTQTESNEHTWNGDPSVHCTSGSPSTPPAVTQERITCHPEKDWRDKTKFWFEIGGILLLGVYTLYTIKMYCANKESADAAKSAADTAARQETLWELSQRPWVEVTDPSIRQLAIASKLVPQISPGQPFFQNYPYHFAWTIKASGNTPAVHTNGSAQPRFVESPSPRLPNYSNIATPTIDSCAVTAEWERGISTWFPGRTYPRLSNAQIAGEEDMRALMAGDKVLFWVGCERYEDATGRRYQTNFCFHWPSGQPNVSGWMQCVTGNDLIEYPVKAHP
jgi:hypothetical protein